VDAPPLGARAPLRLAHAVDDDLAAPRTALDRGERQEGRLLLDAEVDRRDHARTDAAVAVVDRDLDEERPRRRAGRGRDLRDAARELLAREGVGEERELLPEPDARARALAVARVPEEGVGHAEGDVDGALVHDPEGEPVRVDALLELDPLRRDRRA